MLQELAAQTGAAGWAIGSMLFFLAAWVAVVAWVVRRRPEDMEAQSRLPFEGDGELGRKNEPGFGNQESGIRDAVETSGTAPTPES